MRVVALVVVLALACFGCTPRPHPSEPQPVATVSVRLDASAPSATAIETADDAGARPGGRCVVEVGQQISADVFRGVPRSQAREDSYARLDPKTAADWDAHDHGLLYLSCVYAITMNGQRFQFQHIAKDGFSGSRDLEPAQCALPATRDDALKSIKSATHDCEDPHRGAYWGFDLVPLP